MPANRYLISSVAAMAMLASASSVAAIYKGSCYDPGEQRYQKCEIDITDTTISFDFKKDEVADQSVENALLTEIIESEDSKIGAITVMVSVFLKKKVSEFTLTYTDSEGKPDQMAFNVKRKHANSVRTELLRKTEVDVQRVD